MMSYADGLLSDVMIGPAIVEYLDRINAVQENESPVATEMLHRVQPRAGKRSGTL